MVAGTGARPTPRRLAEALAAAQGYSETDAQRRWRQAQLAADKAALGALFDLHVARPLSVKGYPAPEPEWPFLHADRDWHWDEAYLTRGARIVIDLQGGLYGRRNTRTGAWEAGKRSGHTSADGYRRDCEKHRAAAIAGLCVLPFTPDDLTDGTALADVERALRAAGLRPARAGGAA